MSKRAIWIGGISLLALAWGGEIDQASAQPQPSHGASVEEVIVTATKRAESLQDVPLSVDAITGESLQRQNIVEVSQLQTTTPNFSYAGSNNPRGAGITIRGVGTNNFSSAIEGSVGIVVDGVPIGRQGAGFTDFFDIERVEILRGPQGTLFGKNASAGVLNIITINPSNTFESRGQLTIGEDDELVARASVSGPLGDRVAARVSAYTTKRDGYITNVANGQDLNNRDEWGARGKIRFDASETLRLQLSFDYSQRKANCCIWTIRSEGANAVLRAQNAAVGIVPGPDNREVNLDGPITIDQHVTGVAAQMDWTLPGGFTLTSITGGRRWDADDENDADSTTAPSLSINNGVSIQKQFTQELRLTSPSDGTVRWVAGLFYFDQDYQLQNTQQGTFGSVLPAGTVLSRRLNVYNGTLNYAAFGDLTWDLSPKVGLFGGLRYTEEKLKTDWGRSFVPGTLPLGTAIKQVGRRKDDAVTWRAGAQYRPADQVMLYASVARGFKGGGFNALLDSPALQTVEPEKPTAYEAGLKSEIFDRRLRINAALFRTTFKNFQAQAVTVTSTGTLAFDVVNAGELRTQGLEVDFTARPTERLTIDGGAAFTDASYVQFRNAPCFQGQTLAQGCAGAGATASQDLTDKRLSNAPKFSGNVSARYEAPLGRNLLGFAQASYAYRGTAYTALDLDPRSVQKGYSLIDAQIGARTEDNRYSLRLWVKNLADTRFVETIADTPLDAGGQTNFIPITAKRQLGATVEVRF